MSLSSHDDAPTNLPARLDPVDLERHIRLMNRRMELGPRVRVEHDVAAVDRMFTGKITVWVPKSRLCSLNRSIDQRLSSRSGDIRSFAMKPKTRQFVILSLLYWALRRLLELVVLMLRSDEAKEVEIVVLRPSFMCSNARSAGRRFASPTAPCSRPRAASCPRPAGPRSSYAPRRS